MTDESISVEWDKLCVHTITCDFLTSTFWCSGVNVISCDCLVTLFIILNTLCINVSCCVDTCVGLICRITIRIVVRSGTGTWTVCIDCGVIGCWTSDISILIIVDGLWLWCGRTVQVGDCLCGCLGWGTILVGCCRCLLGGDCTCFRISLCDGLCLGDCTSLRINLCVRWLTFLIDQSDILGCCMTCVRYLNSYLTWTDDGDLTSGRDGRILVAWSDRPDCLYWYIVIKGDHITWCTSDGVRTLDEHNRPVSDSYLLWVCQVVICCSHSDCTVACPG